LVPRGDYFVDTMRILQKFEGGSERRLFCRYNEDFAEIRGRFRVEKMEIISTKQREFFRKSREVPYVKKRKLFRQNKGSSSENRGRFRVEKMEIISTKQREFFRKSREVPCGKKGNYCDKTKGFLLNIEGYEKKGNCFVKYLRKRERM
jgi:translation initiation factor 2 beta subunit (eIF-2beta)/eIF-5